MFTDLTDQVITTESAEAAALYAEGVRLLIAGSPDAAAVLGATVAADPAFGVALAALALSSRDAALLDDVQASVAAPSAATRRERQHVEIVALAVAGDHARACALGSDHLREFPGDLVVAHLVARRCRVGR